MYQPKIHLKSNKVIGAEALMRYKKLKYITLNTKDIIEFAEKNNYIHKVDYKIAEETMKTLNFYLLNELLDLPFRISFNVSIKTILRDDFIPTINLLMRKYNISSEYLEIEITESILPESFSYLNHKLEVIMNLGIHISLDDFTAGNSFKTLINHIPINSIKFDKEILKKVTLEPSKNNSIYQIFISLAKSLNLMIVAEGVETPLQLEFLKKNNIDIVQGYLINPPLSQENFINKYFINK